MEYFKQLIHWVFGVNATPKDIHDLEENFKPISLDKVLKDIRSMQISKTSNDIIVKPYYDYCLNNQKFFGGGDGILIDKPPSFSDIVYSSKKHNFYGGGNAIPFENTVKKMSADLEQAKLNLKKQEELVREINLLIEEELHDSCLKEKILNDKFAPHISSDYLNEIILGVLSGNINPNNYSRSTGVYGRTMIGILYSSNYVIERFTELQRAQKLVKALSKQIAFLFNLVKKRLRNLRQVFTKLHSFHFKNLDDYHSLALTSVIVG